MDGKSLNATNESRIAGTLSPGTQRIIVTVASATGDN
jgi:hypothetical protein